ncbi:MAG TPA: hypothetical protein VKD71_06520 [Gemmataceae bacterium]|nr:hypothetical protein [Gemmataceae bacterium]
MDLYQKFRLGMLLGFLLVMIVGKTEAQQVPARALHIGAARVDLTQDQFNPTLRAIRAFIETESLSPNCLATFAESDFAIATMSMWCGSRVQDGKRGVLISIFYPVPPPATFFVEITLYQEGARQYAAPVLFTE